MKRQSEGGIKKKKLRPIGAIGDALTSLVHSLKLLIRVPRLGKGEGCGHTVRCSESYLPAQHLNMHGGTPEMCVKELLMWKVG